MHALFILLIVYALAIVIGISEASGPDKDWWD